MTEWCEWVDESQCVMNQYNAMLAGQRMSGGIASPFGGLIGNVLGDAMAIGKPGGGLVFSPEHAQLRLERREWEKREANRKAEEAAKIEACVQLKAKSMSDCDNQTKGCAEVSYPTNGCEKEIVPDISLGRVLKWAVVLVIAMALGRRVWEMFGDKIKTGVDRALDNAVGEIK